MKIIKKIIPLMLIVCMLSSCSKTAAGHDLSTYETNGYYNILGSDTEYIDYADAAISSLITSGGNYSAEYITFERGEDNKFSKTDAQSSYTLYNAAITDARRLYRDNTDGTKYYPDQFIKYTLDGKNYYNIGALTDDADYASSEDGSVMIFKSNDGLLVKYDAAADTLTPVGVTEYGGNTFKQIGKNWVKDFAMDSTGRYIMYTSVRRTYEQKPQQVDVWLYDTQTGTESVFQENVSPYSGINIYGGKLYYCLLAATDTETTYTYHAIDIASKKDVTINWDKSKTSFKNGYMTGQSKIYNLESGKTVEADSTVNGNMPETAVSLDGKHVISLFTKDESLFFNVVDTNKNEQTHFKLPDDFLANFKDFHIISMDGSTVLLQAMFYSKDKSGDYTAYYNIDLSFVLN